MAVASVLDLIFRTRKQGSGAQEVQQELRDVAAGIAEFGAQAASVLAISAAGVAAYNQVLNLGQMGYESRRAGLALEAYAGGAEEAALATELVSQAADGALSRFAATQNAARLFSMGLASTAEEAARLTRIAVTLGTSMGRGPQEAFEDFTLMLANQSILRLDTFGISGARVRQRMEELAQQGIAPLDRQTRFMIATMEEAETRLLALEQAGYQAATPIERSRAAFEDSRTAMAEWLAGFIDLGLQAEGPARTSLYRWQRGVEDADAAGQNLGRTVRDDLIPSLAEMGVAPPPPDLPAWREGLAGLAAQAESMADGFQNANTNLSGFISQTRDTIAWIQGGGLELQQAAQGVIEAFQQGAITQEQADELLRPIQAAALGLQEEMGQITMTDAARTMAQEWGGSWASARSEIQGAAQDIENIPAEVQTAIRVAVTWQLAGAGVYGQRGYQHGGSFMVEGPPGPDRVPVAFMASAGERVTVETPRQQAAGGRGGMTIGQLNLYSGLDMRAFRKMQYEFLGG